MWSGDECDACFSDDSDNDASSPAARHEAAIIEDPEMWMDYYSEELLDLWHSLKDQCTGRGLAILDTGTFPDFAQFCFQFSSGHPPPV